jgi:hypothetical protein
MVRTAKGRANSYLRLSGALETNLAVTCDALAAELITMCFKLLQSYGLKKSRLQSLARSALQHSSRKKISSGVLATAHKLSDLIAKWGDDPLYLDATGKPAVLGITGAGNDFASLAKGFFPRSSIRDVLDFGCETKAIEKVGKERVARLNDCVVFTGNSLLILANAVQTIRRYLSTANFNRKRRVVSSLISGRTDRASAFEISEDDVAEYLRFMRLQVSDLAEMSTRWLSRRAKAKFSRGERKRHVGVHAFLFVE